MTYTPVHGKGASLFYDIYDMSTYFNKINANTSMDEVETTTFQAANKTWLVGYGDAKVTAEGFWDGTAVVGSDAVLSNDLGSPTNNVLIYVPAGATTVGTRAQFCPTKETSFEVNQSVGDAVKTKGEWRGDGGLIYGFNLHDASATESGTTNPAGTALPASITMTQAQGALCVTAFTGTSMVVKIQYSLAATPAVWVDLITFTTVTAPTKEFKSVTGLSVATTANIRGMIFAYTAPGSTKFALTGIARV